MLHTDFYSQSNPFALLHVFPVFIVSFIFQTTNNIDSTRRQATKPSRKLCFNTFQGALCAVMCSHCVRIPSGATAFTERPEPEGNGSVRQKSYFEGSY